MGYNDFMTDELHLEYVRLDTLSQWKRNAKRHDIGALIESIERHGFKDPPKWEPKLNDGDGGIVEGNGRDIALMSMYKANGKPAPRGIKTDKDGMWLMPVLFGVDAESQQAADHNTELSKGDDIAGIRAELVGPQN